MKLVAALVWARPETRPASTSRTLQLTAFSLLLAFTERTGYGGQGYIRFPYPMPDIKAQIPFPKTPSAHLPYPIP